MTDTTPATPAVWFITGAATAWASSWPGPPSTLATASSEPPARAKVTAALGEHGHLLAVSLDVTDPTAARPTPT